MPAMAHRLLITPEHLLSAWQQRRRTDWPETYAEAIGHELLGRIVRAEAVRLAQAEQRAAKAPLPLINRLGPRWPARQPSSPRPAPFDARRAAANDLKDDDQ